MHVFLFSLLCLVVFHQLQLCLVTPVFLSSPHASLRSRSSQSEESCVKGEELKQLASAQYKMGTSLNYGSCKTTAAEPEYEIVELNSSPLTIGQTWAQHFKWNEPEWTLGIGTITAANMLTPDSQNISSLAHLRFLGVNTDVGLYIISHSASNWVCFAFVLCLFQFSYHTFPHCFLTSFHLHYFSFSIFSCSISFSTSWLYYFQPVPTSLPRSCMSLLSSHFPHLLTSCFLRFFPPWIYYPWPCFLSSSSPPSSTIFCLPPLLSPTAAFKFDSITFQFHFPSSCSRLSVVPSYSFQGQSERIGMESDTEREKMKREENGH